MGEFNNSWEGWQFLATPDQALDRMMDPNGGVVLLETGVDAHTVIDHIATRADDFIGNTGSEASEYIHFNSRTGRLYDDKYRPLLKGKVAHMGRLARALKDVTEPIRAPLFKLERSYRVAQTDSLTFSIQRRSELRPTHTDFSILTTWLGATDPALRLRVNGEWWVVDDVPVGHALAWRGEIVEDSDPSLKAVQHQAAFRRRKRRVVLVGG